MEEEIRETIYTLIIDILKSYIFPIEKQEYGETVNEFINRLSSQYPNVKEQLFMEMNKYYDDINYLIVGCIYAIAKERGKDSLKTTDIVNSVQKVNYILEQMNLRINRNSAVEEENSTILK